jgi:hypothetical protein
MRKIDDVEGKNKGGLSASSGAPISAEEKEETSDWWDGFQAAVEDPDTSIYEYIRDQAVESLSDQEDEQDRSFFEKARRRALKELVSLKNPKDLRDKLETLEENTLVFNFKIRVMMKVARAVIDTYITAQEELIKESKKTKDPEKAKDNVKKAVEKKLAENPVGTGIEALAKSLEDKDEEEIRETIEKAAQQLSEEENLELFSKDFFKIARKYLTLDNLTDIAIVALPLVTWKYRWALAVGLGTYAARMSIVHGFKAGVAGITGKKEVYQKEGKKAVESLKAAGGNVLTIGLSPFVGKAPKILAGLLNFSVKTSYSSVLDTIDQMLDEEEKKPGSTPLSKKLKKGTKEFLDKHQNSLANLSAKFLKSVVPTAVTVAVVEVSNRISFKKLTTLFNRSSGLAKSLKVRFNGASEEQIVDELNNEDEELKEIREEFELVKSDVADVGQQIQESLVAASKSIEPQLRSDNTPDLSAGFDKNSAAEVEEDSPEEDNSNDSDDYDVGVDDFDSPSP